MKFSTEGEESERRQLWEVHSTGRREGEKVKCIMKFAVKERKRERGRESLTHLPLPSNSHLTRDECENICPEM